MKIRFMGACQEVGRSAFAVSMGEKYLVLDYGVMVNHHVGFPMHIPPKEVEAIVKSEGKRILYPGDFNRQPTRLVDGADPEYKNLDAIVMEGTYAMEDHPIRDGLEKEFVQKVTEVVEGGGTVLVPAFGVGRSQELLSVLSAYHFEHPVFVDGMALDAMDLLLKHPAALRDAGVFERASKMAHWVDGWNDRRRAAKTPGVIISPAGMLKGGASVFYMENVAAKKENAVFMVSFQVPGSPGRILLERKKFVIHGRARPVDARVERFDFSSHGGRRELEQTLSDLDKKTRVFIVHGAEGNCKKLADWASMELGLNASAPKTGDVVEI